MCLNVHPYGTGDGKCTHVSVYLNIMKGEFDDQFLWPFLGEITVQLVNQTQNRGHCENTLYFNESAAAGRVSHRTFEAWMGYNHFVLMLMLRPPQQQDNT